MKKGGKTGGASRQANHSAYNSRNSGIEKMDNNQKRVTSTKKLTGPKRNGKRHALTTSDPQTIENTNTSPTNMMLNFDSVISDRRDPMNANADLR